MVRENKTECKMTFRNEEPHVNKCFPRVRGDVPKRATVTVNLPSFSPRARGCSCGAILCRASTLVFPACAGMFPATMPLGREFSGFPRVRGDVPCGH